MTISITGVRSMFVDICLSVHRPADREPAIIIVTEKAIGGTS
jgi:hypothetical protein